MRILSTVEFYWPWMGGAEDVVREISERLAARGHDVTVATTAVPERTSREHRGMKIVEFPIAGNLAGGFRGETQPYLDFLRGADVDLMMNYALQEWLADLALLDAPELCYGKVMATCGLSGQHMPTFESYFHYLYEALFNEVVAVRARSASLSPASSGGRS